MEAVLIHPLKKMTSDQFFQFCQKNKDRELEMDENGNIIIMEPTGLETSHYNSELNAELVNWNRQEKKGIVGDSNAGFTLPDGAVRSPDVSWVSKERLKNITKEEFKKFAPVSPEFTLELKSENDKLADLQTKSLKYISNGCLLCWLIDRDTQTVYIYRANGSHEVINGFHKKLSGENVLPGFELDLSILLE